VKSVFFRVPKEEGFVLITSLVMLAILTLFAAFALNTTKFELQMAGNDKVIKETFFRADGGVQAGIELIEQNLSCPKGFSLSIPGSINGVDIYDNRLAYAIEMSDIAGATPSVALGDLPSDTIRAIRIPVEPAIRADNKPHTNLATWGVTKLGAGTAIQMIAGYEGKGKGTGGGGAYIEYELHSQHYGVVNSEARIASKWRHMIGQEGTCNY
jgi:type IV pilus assembly PilX-like protein